MPFIDDLGPLSIGDQALGTLVTSAIEQRLLAALVVAHPGSLPVDVLLRHLWPDESVDKRRLWPHVSRLRKRLEDVFGEGLTLEQRNSGYVLAGDVERASRRFSDEVESASRLESHPERTELLRRAIGRWRGPFMVGFDVETLQPGAGRRVEDVWASASLELGDLYNRQGDHDEAVRRGREVLAIHPYDEVALAITADGLQCSGRSVEARRLLHEFRIELAREIGIEPGAAFDAVEQRIHGVSEAPPLARSTKDTSEPWPKEATGSGMGLDTGRLGNLAAPSSTFVGRVSEIEQLTAQIEAHRLTTLVGPGGVGKTRLAVEAARRLANSFRDGVWLVELQHLAGPALSDTALAEFVGTALGIPSQNTHPTGRLMDWLRAGERLLVLDNCEHLLEPVSRLVANISSSGANTVMVATSREPLRSDGERVWHVSPLDQEREAVELFLDRASAADSSFEVIDGDRSDVTALCRRLDGLPLAIELAAARVRAVTPAELVGRIDVELDVLRRRGGTGSGRHDTLTRTLDWSYDMLQPDEQALFDRLSVFGSSFELGAAEAVCSADDLDPLQIARMLFSLVDKSLVVPIRGRRLTRYRMLETVRSYARRHLESREFRRLSGAHAAYVADQCMRAQASYEGDASANARGHAVFEHEWDNVRQAVAWLVDFGDGPAAGDLVESSFFFAWCAGPRVEHGLWAQHALSAGAAAAGVWGVAACWSALAGDHDEVSRQTEAGLRVAGSAESADLALCHLANAFVTTHEPGKTKWNDFIGRYIRAGANAGRPFMHAHGCLIANRQSECNEFLERVRNPVLDAFAQYFEVRTAPSEEWSDRYALVEAQASACSATMVVGMARKERLAASAGAGEGSGARFVEVLDSFARLDNWMDHTTAVVRLAQAWRDQGRADDVDVLKGYLRRGEQLGDHASSSRRRGAAMTAESLASFVLERWEPA